MTGRKRRDLTEIIAQTAPEPPVVGQEPTTAPDGPTWRKFTMRVDDVEDERARQVTDDVVRRARVRPTKGMRADVVRAMWAEAEEDPQLRARLASRLRGTATP